MKTESLQLPHQDKIYRLLTLIPRKVHLSLVFTVLNRRKRPTCRQITVEPLDYYCVRATGMYTQEIWIKVNIV